MRGLGGEKNNRINRVNYIWITYDEVIGVGYYHCDKK